MESELRESAVEVKTSGSRVSTLQSKTCLVRRESEPAFLAAVDRCTDKLAECGLRLTLNGPWPPYSFVPERLLEVDDG